jgi:mannose-6-phosphate isomerase
LTKVAGEEQQTLLELRENQPLDFLLKILAAGNPLSLQAHPNSEQAKIGFAKENSLGIALDAPNRSYKDDRHKPEMLVALTPFDALAGFRPVEESIALFRELASNTHPVIGLAFNEWLGLLKTGLQEFFVHVSHLRGQVDQVTAALAQLEPSVFGGNAVHLELVKELEMLYPGDPGIIVSLVMNHIHLEPEQAIQIGAGQVHAYVRGLGVEIMASSDNVLRGGLTPKHIDVDELQRVVVFEGVEPNVLHAKQLATGLFEYPRAVGDYLLYRLEVSATNLLADIKLPSAAIVLCTSGEIAVGNSLDERQVLRKGQAAYLDQAKFFSFSGSGTAYLATA